MKDKDTYSHLNLEEQLEIVNKQVEYWTEQLARIQRQLAKEQTQKSIAAAIKESKGKEF
jgi:hypothetical protein